MSPEERQLLTALFDRIRTAAATPRDAQAESLIDQATREQPYAAYYLAQAVIVQEKGLEAAANHIKELEERIRQIEAQDSEHHHAEQGGGFLNSIFGSSQPRDSVPQPGPWDSGSRQDLRPSREQETAYRQPQPTGPWNPQPSAPSAGGSFLRGALGTAAGVAGGMLLANSLSGIFSNHMNSLGWGSPLAGGNPFGNGPTEETVVNNYYGDDAVRQAADDGNTDDGLQQADDDSDDQSDFGDDDLGGDDTMDV
ncbi:DUF2076 domain-containing protein [Rhizobium sp. LCM 4573]|uniref:DUF2076 domain-containing protein n=1 Tax=Rhizobium sp. LCM 4573 TaxID=1848291 RepID=UPI0008D95F10|nr:DUF2076 domain-containing protein [Rhizobium sp. LCM 4573]OHV84368.1 ABC transporter substrate-binding protein [Rhizobium sp. LCM 4573]